MEERVEKLEKEVRSLQGQLSYLQSELAQIEVKQSSYKAVTAGSITSESGTFIRDEK